MCHFKCLPLHGSDLDKPLAPWRRRAIEVSSSGASRLFLMAMGFWRPRLIGLHNYELGKQIGAVGDALGGCG